MAAVGTRYVTPDQFEIDAVGAPLGGGMLFFYATGTSTPQDTFADVTLATPNPNPVIADANGRFGNIWLIPSNAYKVVLFTAPTVDDPSGTQIWSFDPVGPASGGAQSSSVGIIGEIRSFAGPAANIPAQWYVCNGAAISRTTYASLFAVIGTTWGAGDMSTTFNLPDLRGRLMAGKDDMGGTAANRITSGVAGISGVTLGAAGGDQRFFQHTHTVNDPGHYHTITDPGHSHTFSTYAGGGGTLGTGPPAGFSNNFNKTPFTIPTNTTGITIDTATTGITNANAGTGTTSQNVQPTAMVNMIIFAGA